MTCARGSRRRRRSASRRSAAADGSDPETTTPAARGGLRGPAWRSSHEAPGGAVQPLAFPLRAPFRTTGGFVVADGRGGDETSSTLAGPALWARVGTRWGQHGGSLWT